MLDLTQLKFQYITDKMGEKTAVILPIPEFQDCSKTSKTLPMSLNSVKSRAFPTMRSWLSSGEMDFCKRRMEAFCAQELKKLPRGFVGRIVKAVQQFSTDPYPSGYGSWWC